VTSAFLKWLATDNRITDFQSNAGEQLGGYRETWLASKVASIKRTASTLAQLTRAWSVFLHFALESGAYSQVEVEELWNRIKKALKRSGEAQTKFQLSENPATRFVELIQAALLSGRAHLADVNGGSPDNRESWGWRDGEPQGDRIGWIEADDIYLQPDAAYSAAQRMATGGEGLTVSSQTLWKRLKEAGLLASVDTARQTQKVRRQIGEKQEGVIHVRDQIFTQPL
jgi:hypothetical protein